MHLQLRPFVPHVLCVSALAAAGCARPVRYYEPPPIDGMQFSATARRAGPDSVLVLVKAHSGAKASRALESGMCGDPLVLRAYRASARPGPAVLVWDSANWRRATDPPNQVCLPVAVRQEVVPGGSADVAALALPMRVILGDSLSAGEYRLTARLNSNGWAAGEIESGTIELRVPPT